MTEILKLYDVYDIGSEDFLLERATLADISDEIGVEIPYIRQCMSRKYKIKSRYLVTLSEPIPDKLLIMWDAMVSGIHKGVICK